MKAVIYLLLGIGCALAPVRAQNLQPLGKASTEFEILERGPHHRVWTHVDRITNAMGQVQAYTNAYTELESGMHYWADGEWKDSSPQIQVADQGAVATGAPHQASFAANLNSPVAVDLLTPDGKRLKSHIVGLSYFDSATGDAVLLAVLKDSIGQLLPPNQAIYPDAFDGVEADVQYIYTKGGFEQNIVLRAQPPAPETWGLNPQTTRLQVITEFVDSSLPSKTVRRDSAAAVEDETLDFGQMKIGRGRAFALANSSPVTESVTVRKQWINSKGRTFLVEEVSLEQVGKRMAALSRPRAARTAAIKSPAGGRNVIAALAGNLPVKTARPETAGKMLLAQTANWERPGFVLDYALLTGASNFVFKADTTYFCTNTVNLYGTTTIEGGTVIKFSTNITATLNVHGEILCKTGPYRPAIFTAKDDNTAGENIAGSSGLPTGRYGGTGLILPFLETVPTASLRYLRFSHLRTGVDCTVGGHFKLYDLQFVSCTYPLAVAGGDHDLFNVLIYNANAAFYGGGNIFASHLTVNTCGILAYDYDSYGSVLQTTNSLFVLATNLGNYTIETNSSYFIGAGETVFQTVGAGMHYLAEFSPYRNAGTTNLSAQQRGELITKTTYPPAFYDHQAIMADVTLSPNVPRDTDAPDLGYHYEPLDHAFGGVWASNATISLARGTVMGGYSSGLAYSLALLSGANFRSEGSPNEPNWIVRYNLVQEQANRNWTNDYLDYTIIGNFLGGNSNQISSRFTKWAAAAGGNRQFTDYRPFLSAVFTDCEFYGGIFVSYGSSIKMTNCLFERVSFNAAEDYGPTDVVIRNCLFYGGGAGIDHYDLGNWVVRDNLFDGAGISQWENFTTDYNAYTPGSSRLLPNGTHDLVTNVSYRVGPLGNYYQATNSALINRGSISNAATIGLYHYTVTTNLVGGWQIKETNSIVDIGYHYVATDTNGWASDLDADGLADYEEDANGNGTRDAGETGISSYDTDNDGLSDLFEIDFYGTDPTAADADNDGNSDGDEIYYGLDPFAADYPYLIGYSADQTVYAGSNVTLSVTMTGSVLTNYHFQWRRNSSLVPGATNISLTLSNVSVTNAGLYSVWVTNQAGLVKGPLMRLTVWQPGWVRTFGDDSYGQRTFPEDFTNVVGLAGGVGHSVMLRSNGTVRAYGSLLSLSTNYFGELNVPAGLTNVAAVAAGSWHNLALKQDGTVVAWGDNTYGQTNVPPELSYVVAIAAGDRYSCALKNNGTVVVWGDDSFGQLRVPYTITNVVSLAAGYAHVLALTAEGKVKGWGNEDDGVLAIPANVTNVIAIAAGVDHSCALQSNGIVRVWGGNGFSQTNVPANVTNIVRLSSGWHNVLVSKANGDAISWGRDLGSPGALDEAFVLASGRLHGLGLVPDGVSGFAARGVAGVAGCENPSTTDDCECQTGNLFEYGVDTDYDGRSDAQEPFDGTDPKDPNSVLPIRLAYWSFDDAGAWRGERGQKPVAVSGVSAVTGRKGGALEVSGSGKSIRFPAREADNSANINFRKGTIRFWYKPNWSTATASPAARYLIYMPELYSPRWALRVTPYFITFEQSGECGQMSYTSINWTAGVWHQIAITYAPGSYKIYVDGALVYTGTPSILYIPSVMARQRGFNLGSTDGTQSAEGAFDDLETFNYAKTTTEISTDYYASLATSFDTDGDGMDDAWETFYHLNPASAADAATDFDNDGLTNLQEYRAGTNPEYPIPLEPWSARPKSGSRIP